MILWSSAALAATPFLGAEWRPLSRGDLSWVDDGRTTGLSVGGQDGFVSPPLSAYGGAWLGERIGLQGGLGVARLQTTTRVDDVWTQRHWGVVRPSMDLKLGLLPRTDPRPVPWALLGARIDLPSSRDASNGYSPEEQRTADQVATDDRRRLGALGARAGLGADLGLAPALRVGLCWTLEWQRSLLVGADPAAVSSWVTAQGALLVQLEWPTPEG